MGKIVSFLSGNAVTISRSSNGRNCGKKTLSLQKMWNFSRFQLEHIHDYIQWMFPLDKASSFNPLAPILTKNDIEFIQKSPDIQSNLLKSFEVMLNFYGFELDTQAVVVRQIKSKPWMARHWLKRNNHNLLRVTRILECLSLCGLKKYAEAFYAAIVELGALEENITKDTLVYWQDALL